MRYKALMLNVSQSYYYALKLRFGGMEVDFTTPLTIQQAVSLCTEQTFHLLVFRFADFTSCADFFIALRRINFAPAIALVDKYDAYNASNVLQSGADLCLSTDWPIDLVIDHIMAQFRRHVSYDRQKKPGKNYRPSIQEGDIYIDPKRRIVRVKERSVKLRRREFLLLLYFMEHPKHVLSATEICNHAWGNGGSYAHGVSGPVSILRKAIEPDPSHPIYIKTVNKFGYCFTAYKSETCDTCSDSVGVL